jgi:hypothetical protein
MHTGPSHMQRPCSSVLNAPRMLHREQRCHNRLPLPRVPGPVPPRAPHAAPAGPHRTPFYWHALSRSPAAPIFSSALTRAAAVRPQCFLLPRHPTTPNRTTPPSRLPVAVCPPPTTEHRRHSKELEPPPPPPWLTITIAVKSGPANAEQQNEAELTP